MALGKNKPLVIVLVVAVLLLCCCVASVAALFLFIPDPLPENIEIPDMVGMTVPEARDALSIRSEITLVEDAEAEPGTVVAQSHEPGTKTHHDDIVRLEVAGPIEVPDIVGMDAREAQELLYNAGYDTLDYRYDPEATGTDGTVISQDPEGGTETMMLAISYVIAGENPYEEY